MRASKPLLYFWSQMRQCPSMNEICIPCVAFLFNLIDCLRQHGMYFASARTTVVALASPFILQEVTCVCVGASLAGASTTTCVPVMHNAFMMFAQCKCTHASCVPDTRKCNTGIVLTSVCAIKQQTQRNKERTQQNPSIGTHAEGSSPNSQQVTGRTSTGGRPTKRRPDQTVQQPPRIESRRDPPHINFDNRWPSQGSHSATWSKNGTTLYDPC